MSHIVTVRHGSCKPVMVRHKSMVGQKENGDAEVVVVEYEGPWFEIESNHSHMISHHYQSALTSAGGIRRKMND